MLVYIIDGYNLAHKIPELKRASEMPEATVNYIRLKRLTGSRNNKVIIVFDGYRRENAAICADYQIIFSAQISADEVIKKRVAGIKNKSQVIVVSDDREIRDYAKTAKVKSIAIAEFTNRRKKAPTEAAKDISYTLQKEITDEMRKIWDL